MKANNSIWQGTAGGTLCSVFPMFNSTEFIKTIVLAAIGAVVSFLVSYLIKMIFYKK
jgi:mannitol-specific phosphotransferase system IIBC component